MLIAMIKNEWLSNKISNFLMAGTEIKKNKFSARFDVYLYCYIKYFYKTCSRKAMVVLWVTRTSRKTYVIKVVYAPWPNQFLTLFFCQLWPTVYCSSRGKYVDSISAILTLLLVNRLKNSMVGDGNIATSF